MRSKDSDLLYDSNPCAFNRYRSAERDSPRVRAAADLPYTTRVYNSVFHNNGRAVVQSLQQNAHVITNCIFHFDSAALHTDVGSGSQTSYNDFWGNDAVYYGSASLPPAGNYAVDPQFVDPAGGNFHLQSTSPLVDHGSPALLDDDLTVSDVGMYGGPMPRLRLLAVSPSKGTVTTIFRFAVVLHDVVPPAPFLSPPGTDASAVAGQAVPALHLWGTGANLFVKPTTSDATPADGAKSVYYFGPLGYQDKFKFRYETRTPFGEWLYGPSTTGYRSFTVGPAVVPVHARWRRDFRPGRGLRGFLLPHRADTLSSGSGTCNSLTVV